MIVGPIYLDLVCKAPNRRAICLRFERLHGVCRPGCDYVLFTERYIMVSLVGYEIRSFACSKDSRVAGLKICPLCVVFCILRRKKWVFVPWKRAETAGFGVLLSCPSNGFWAALERYDRLSTPPHSWDQTACIIQDLVVRGDIYRDPNADKMESSPFHLEWVMSPIKYPFFCDLEYCTVCRKKTDRSHPYCIHRSSCTTPSDATIMTTLAHMYDNLEYFLRDS